MTISAIVICILILLLALSLGVNVWFAETLSRLEPDLDENSPRFGWTGTSKHSPALSMTQKRTSTPRSASSTS